MLPTQTMHYYKENPSKSPYICIELFDPPKNRWRLKNPDIASALSNCSQKKKKHPFDQNHLTSHDMLRLRTRKNKKIYVDLPLEVKITG